MLHIIAYVFLGLLIYKFAIWFAEWERELILRRLDKLMNDDFTPTHSDPKKIPNWGKQSVKDKLKKTGGFYG